MGVRSSVHRGVFGDTLHCYPADGGTSGTGCSEESDRIWYRRRVSGIENGACSVDYHMVFVFSVGMVYLSGGLIPSMFLTEGMQAAGQYLPTTYLMQAAGGFLTGRITGATGQCAAVLCGYTAIFGGIAFLKNSCT